jgi:hypothetical protein
MITTTHGDPQLFQDWPSAELNSMSSYGIVGDLFFILKMNEI